MISRKTCMVGAFALFAAIVYGETVIEDFDAYTDSAELMIAYSSADGGVYEFGLEVVDTHFGNAMYMSFDNTIDRFARIHENIPGGPMDLSGENYISIWAKGSSEGQTLGIVFIDSLLTGASRASILLTCRWRNYEIALVDFEIDPDYESGATPVDWTTVAAIRLQPDGFPGTIRVDEIKAIGIPILPELETIPFLDEFDGFSGDALGPGWRRGGSVDNSAFEYDLRGVGELVMTQKSDSGNRRLEGNIHRIIGSGDFNMVVTISDIKFHNLGGMEQIVISVFDRRTDWGEAWDGVQIAICNGEQWNPDVGEHILVQYANGTQDTATGGSLFKGVKVEIDFEFPIKIGVKWRETMREMSVFYGMDGKEPINHVYTIPNYQAYSQDNRWIELSIRQHTPNFGVTTVHWDKFEIVRSFLLPQFVPEKTPTPSPSGDKMHETE